MNLTVMRLMAMALTVMTLGTARLMGGSRALTRGIPPAFRARS